jgi:RNA polymerase sigma factor (sigma-70 family)
MNATQYEHWDGVSLHLWQDAQGGDNHETHKRLLENLSKAIERELTPRQRQVLLLRYREELGVTQIADRLGVDKSTVCHTLKRAKGRLRRVLRYSF